MLNFDAFNIVGSPQSQNKLNQTFQDYYQRRITEKITSQRRISAQITSPNNKKQQKNKARISKDISVNKTKPKREKKDYKINPLYASRISQLFSEISIPDNSVKFSTQALVKLQSRISSQIFTLREQKIAALQRLNKTKDKKNKIIQLIKNHEMLKELDKNDQLDEINTQIGHNERPQYMMNAIRDSYNNRTINLDYRYSTSKVQRVQQNQISRASKRISNELIASKISHQAELYASATHQAEKIRQQLMKPLAQHPLLIKNKDLQDQINILQQQLKSIGNNEFQNLSKILEISAQNDKLQSELNRQILKLASIQKNRFQTFFPQDKKKLLQMNNLIKLQQQLQAKKQSLLNQVMNGTIIKRAEDQIYLDDLKQENRRLIQQCDKLLAQHHNSTYQYNEYTTDELQRMVQQQQHNRRSFVQILEQFKDKIRQIEQGNQRKSNTRFSHYY